MHLDRFSAFLRRHVSPLAEDVRAKLLDAPWAAAGERIVTPTVPAASRVLLVSWEHSGSGGVWLDADDQESAFSDGAINPRPVLDGSEFFDRCFGRPAAELPSELVSVTIECLTYLCAEALVQHATLLGADTFALAVQPGHDETPRVVFRSETPATSIFDEQGAFLLPTDEELIERAPNDGHALAKLVELLASGTDTMKLLGKVDAVFHRVARSGKAQSDRAEARALAAAISTHHERLELQGWGELYEQVMAKALVCSVGDRETFELVLDALMPVEEFTFGGLAFNLACLHALFGDRDEALAAVKVALELGYEPERFDDADFDSLRDDPDFIALVSELSEEGLTAELAEAVSELEVAKVEALIAAGADVNGEHDGDAVLVLAFSGYGRTKEKQARRRAIVGALLDAGATLPEDEWPWYRIIDDAELLSFLLERGVAVTGKLLAQLVEKEAVATLELLVSKGVELGPHVAQFHAACRHHRSPGTLRYLVSKGVDFSQPHEGVPFALGFGSAGNVVMLDALLELGLDMHGRDGQGGCLISHALFNDKHEVVRWAIAHGAALDVTDRRGSGLVLSAIDAGATQSFQVLLDAGAPVGLADELGRTALHAAAERNNTAFVKALLAKGASKEPMDTEGQRPLDRAEQAELKALLQP